MTTFLAHIHLHTRKIALSTIATLPFRFGLLNFRFKLNDRVLEDFGRCRAHDLVRVPNTAKEDSPHSIMSPAADPSGHRLRRLHHR